MWPRVGLPTMFLLTVVTIIQTAPRLVSGRAAPHGLDDVGAAIHGVVRDITAPSPAALNTLVNATVVIRDGQPCVLRRKSMGPALHDMMMMMSNDGPALPDDVGERLTQHARTVVVHAVRGFLEALRPPAVGRLPDCGDADGDVREDAVGSSRGQTTAPSSAGKDEDEYVVEPDQNSVVANASTDVVQGVRTGKMTTSSAAAAATSDVPSGSQQDDAEVINIIGSDPPTMMEEMAAEDYLPFVGDLEEELDEVAAEHEDLTNAMHRETVELTLITVHSSGEVHAVFSRTYALVAVIVLVASLLPLAVYHLLRCPSGGDDDEDEDNHNRDASNNVGVARRVAGRLRGRRVLRNANDLDEERQQTSRSSSGDTEAENEKNIAAAAQLEQKLSATDFGNNFPVKDGNLHFVTSHI